MTHDAATIAAINKRIAEFEGWTRIRNVCEHETVPIEETSGLFGVRPCRTMQGFVPDYWHSADAIIPVVERLCRERDLVFWLRFEVHYGFNASLCSVSMDLERTSPTLPAAACLAVVAVLDGAENERAGA